MFSHVLQHVHIMLTELIARLFAAFLISCIARGLYSHTNHKVCYSAVSSGGIVLILPGFAVSEYHNLSTMGIP